ncbi:MAG: apolipoprotein N-acyltransferase [Chitinophagales bacterium]|nr:apolipoprotein N-acyltransferase [Chitinophagales bacterium]
MKSRQKLLLSFASGILLSLAWPPLPFFPLLFIGFVPILWLEDVCSEKKNSARNFFGYAYLALLIWNLLTTWWVGATYFGTNDISTAFAGIFANTANPLLMCIPLIGFHRIKKRLGATMGYISFVAFWIVFEFIHLRWDLTWPWLTLGNGLAMFPQVVQWYSFTGVVGGTAWILILNVLIYRLLYVFLTGKIYLHYKKTIAATAIALLLPIFISVTQYYTYTEKGNEKNVVVVQPNIDPYNDKFDPSDLDQQLQSLLQLSKQKVDANTDYLVWPETAIPQGILINDLQVDETIQLLRNFRKPFPKLKIVTGINAYEQYATDSTPTARKSRDGKFYWDAFNSAIQIDSSNAIPVYHKSKLVPGVEKMPYPALFKFLEPLAINMGGITGSLGSQKDRGVFFSNDKTGIAPLICYESIYGEYSNEYVQRGANLLFVITNDGWWGNTDGYKQHIEYARLRAIETRRDLAQSANTGTSAFINQRGDLYDQTQWWKPAVISATLHANTEETFYVRFGDYISRASILISIVLVIFSFFKKFKERTANIK